MLFDSMGKYTVHLEIEYSQKGIADQMMKTIPVSKELILYHVYYSKHTPRLKRDSFGEKIINHLQLQVKMC